jgi:hypothetical protein
MCELVGQFLEVGGALGGGRGRVKSLQWAGPRIGEQEMVISVWKQLHRSNGEGIESGAPQSQSQDDPRASSSFSLRSLKSPSRRFCSRAIELQQA